MKVTINKTVSLGLIIVLASLQTPAVQAQDTMSLSLQAAVKAGLENSKSLKASAAKVDGATARLNEMRMKQLPDLTASASYMRLNNPTVDLKIPLSAGGEAGGESGGATPDIQVNQLAYGMLNASLPLFSGLQIRHAIASAKHLENASKLDAAQDKNEVIQDIVTAYYNLYKASEAVVLVKENLKQAQSRVADFTNLERNGVLARNDLLKAELQQSNIELTLADAENNRNITQYNLNLLLGIAPQTVLQLSSVEEVSPAAIRDLEEWQQLAATHRPDALALGQQQQAAKSQVQGSKGAYLPAIALTGGYAAGYVPDVVTLSNAMNVGLGLRYDIAGLYKNGAKVKQAKAQQDQLYWASQELADGIKTQVFEAYENYRQALNKIKVYRKAVEQANENYRITRNKYDNALETTTNLLDADVAQLQANINYRYARVDALVAYHKLYEVTGMIQEVYQQ